MGLMPTDHLKRIADELTSIRNLLVQLVDIQTKALGQQQ